MGINGLQWQTIDIPLGIGIDTKGDARSSQPPSLDICSDAQFDEIGGLQTRYPYALFNNVIYGESTSITNARKLVTNGDELLCFTDTALFAWSVELNAWCRRGTHLAIKVNEQAVFTTTGDQHGCDRAELNGTIVYTWMDLTPTVGGAVVAVVDKATGATIVSPRRIEVASVTRVVALDTRILIITGGIGIGPDGGVRVRAIDPADPLPGIVGASTNVISGLIYAGAFDVEKIPGLDEALLVCPTSTGYTIAKITSAPVVTTSAKTRIVDGYLTAQGVMCLAIDPMGFKVLVCYRAIPTPPTQDLLYDLLFVSTLADESVANFLGEYRLEDIGGIGDTPITQITAAFSSTAVAGNFVASVFWADNGNVGVSTTTVTASAPPTTGTQSKLRHTLAIGSRAFERLGSVYVNLLFAQTAEFIGGPLYGFPAQLQNTYFLYRSDGFLCGKAVYTEAAGYQTVHGNLPGVAPTGGNKYAWCATERRIVPIGKENTGYADRGPRDVEIEFDTNEARRCVRLGATLYIACAEGLLQYDGTKLVETGFHFYPFFFSGNQATAGLIPVGTYAYKATYAWTNNRGEVERSTTATSGGLIVSGGPHYATFAQFSNLTVTHKTENPPAIEIWRTLVDPTEDAPYYKASSLDPSMIGTGIVYNEYLPNNADRQGIGENWWSDNLTDELLRVHETNNENGAILENIAPPAASIVVANDTRIFLAGIADDPDRVWYSKLRGEGEIASFHDALTFAVPKPGGKITALGFLNETLIVFRETSIYAFSGDGFGNDGSGPNYGPARLLSGDTGAINAESVAQIEQGLIYKSAKGWFVLTRGWSAEYIGAPVSDYDNETPSDSRVLTDKHQVRIVLPSRVLVWDYLVNQWSVWSISDAIGAALWRGVYQYLTPIGPKSEQSTYTDLTYGLDIETSWIKPFEGIQGDGRIRRILVLGEYRSPHVLRVRIARNYEATASEQWVYFDDQYWDPDPAIEGANEQVRIGPSRQQCEAIKIRITLARRQAVEGGFIYPPPTGEAIKLSGLALEIGTRRGPFRQLPTAQKL